MEPASTTSPGRAGNLKVSLWVDRFLTDLTVVRSANTVQAYRLDLARWIARVPASDGAQHAGDRRSHR